MNLITKIVQLLKCKRNKFWRRWNSGSPVFCGGGSSNRTRFKICFIEQCLGAFLYCGAKRFTEYHCMLRNNLKIPLKSAIVADNGRYSCSYLLRASWTKISGKTAPDTNDAVAKGTANKPVQGWVTRLFLRALLVSSGVVTSTTQLNVSSRWIPAYSRCRASRPFMLFFGQICANAIFRAVWSLAWRTLPFS